MKIQLYLCALVASGSTHQSLAAWTPLWQRSAVTTATVPRPFSMEPLQVSPNNFTSGTEDPSAGGSRSTSSEPQDVNPEVFAAELDQELGELEKKVKADPAMDAYTKALQDMKDVPPASPRSSTAGQGFGKLETESASASDKKKAFMEKNRGPATTDTPASVSDIASDIIADQIVNQLESQTPPKPFTEDKPETSPRDLIQQAKKAKEIPSATAKAMQMGKQDPIIPPPPAPPQPVVAEEKKTYFPPTPLDSKPPKKNQPEEQQQPDGPLRSWNAV